MISKNRNLLVIGGLGRIGRPLVEVLNKRGYRHIIVPQHDKYSFELLDEYMTERLFNEHKPTYVINLFSKTTTIQMCNDTPVSICRDTLLGNMRVLEMCKRHKVEKLLNVLCSCSYDGDTPVLKEEEFWQGSPHKSILAHGLAKRCVYGLSQMYHKQYRMNVVTVALNNIFGGKFIWSKTSNLKFFDSVIRKLIDAKLNNEEEVVLWGTGQPRREVMFYKDAASGLVDIFEQYEDVELINLGNGIDHTIEEWANIIKKAVDYRGKIVFDISKPDGQMQKLFNVDKLRFRIKLSEQTPFDAALKETIDSYKDYLRFVEHCDI